MYDGNSKFIHILYSISSKRMQLSVFILGSLTKHIVNIEIITKIKDMNWQYCFNVIVYPHRQRYHL